MTELIARLETDAHTLTCKEPLGFIESWHIGSDMAHLFAGRPVVRRSTSRADGGVGWPKVRRYYHAPRLPLGVMSDGEYTCIDIDPKRVDIIAVIQAYGDHRRHEEPHTMNMRFVIRARELNGIIRGDDWVFSASVGEGDMAHGCLAVTAPLYVDRLALVAQGLSHIANRYIPDGGVAIVEKHLAPQSLDAMSTVWQEAMDEQTSRRAAQLVLEQCTDIRIRMPS